MSLLSKKEINRITQWPERNGLIGLKLEVIRKIAHGQLVFQSYCWKRSCHSEDRAKSRQSTRRYSSNTQRQNQEVPKHKKMLRDMFLSSAARTQRLTKSTVHSEPLRHAARTNLSNHNLRSCSKAQPEWLVPT